MQRDILACALSLLISAAVLLLAWYFLRSWFGYLDQRDISGIVGASIYDSSSFKPESVEKLQYAASIILFPPLVFFLLAPLRRALSGPSDRRLALAYGAAAFLAAAFLSALAFIDLRAEPSFLNGSVARHPILAALLVFLAVAAMALYRLKIAPLRSGPVKKAFDAGLLLAALFFIVAIPARLILNYRAFLPYELSHHYNAYVYAITQVCSGKALLVDFNDQYGMYPHFLEPVFAVIGLSTFTFLAVMAVLLAIAFLCFYFVLCKCIGDPVIRFLGMGAVLYFGYVFFALIGDPYFQYFPHRVIFPGLLLALAYLNFTRESRPLYLLTFLVAAASMLWNIETGIVVFITWLLALAYRDLLRYRGRSAGIAIARDVATGILILCGTFAAYSLYIYLRYGSFPRLIDMVSYQYYFYGVGFFMLPMPAINPWNLVALVYAVGIVYAARSLLLREASVKAMMIFTLSILGAGIFSYYQGRSHPNVLATVLYPALMLIAIFTDMLYARVLRGLRRRSVAAGEALILAGLLFFLVTSAFALADNHAFFLPPTGAPGPQAYATGMFERNIAFMAEHVKPGEKVLVLCHYSSVYYMGTHTVSPLGVPGFYEIVNRDDMDRIAAFLRSADPDSRQVFVDTFFSNELTDNAYLIQPLLENYRLANISEDGNLMLYDKRRNDTPVVKRSYDTSDDASGVDGILHWTYDAEKHAFFTPDNGFAAFMNGCSRPVTLNDSYSIEVTLRPDKAQAPYAIVLYEMLPWYGYQGFILEKDGAEEGMYAYLYGSGQGLVKALRFKLSDQRPNYLAITDDGRTLTAYVNGTPAASYVKARPLVNFPTPLYVGNYIGLDLRFNGTIYGVTVSDHSLSGAEIAAKSRAPGP